MELPYSKHSVMVHLCDDTEDTKVYDFYYVPILTKFNCNMLYDGSSSYFSVVDNGVMTFYSTRVRSGDRHNIYDGYRFLTYLKVLRKFGVISQKVYDLNLEIQRTNSEKSRVEEDVSKFVQICRSIGVAPTEEQMRAVTNLSKIHVKEKSED